ncbi:MAG: limonene-1,2-epoxide hydrolase family protein [Gammaproteobacteria bacterium]
MLSCSRRTWLAGSAAIGLAACQQLAVAHDRAADRTDLEIANETLVNNFCRDWSTLDVNAITPYLADDLTYQISPGQPLITSLEQFKKQIGPFMAKLESIRWEILRSYVIGPMVLNERIDHFNAAADSKTPSMRFQVAGEFLVEGNKIKVWKDWLIPGTKQFIGKL